MVFNASAQDTQQLLTSVQDLQAANEQLQAQNLQAVTQAEASVAMGEMKLAEKEKRAAAAEEEPDGANGPQAVNSDEDRAATRIQARELPRVSLGAPCGGC